MLLECMCLSYCDVCMCVCLRLSRSWVYDGRKCAFTICTCYSICSACFCCCFINVRTWLIEVNLIFGLKFESGWIFNSRNRIKICVFISRNFAIFGCVEINHLFQFETSLCWKVGNERKRIKSFPCKLVQSKSTAVKKAYFLLCSCATLSRNVPELKMYTEFFNITPLRKTC